MQTKNLPVAINLLMQVREINQVHLPIGHSFIPYEILLLVIYHHLQNEDLTVKKLFHFGSYSEMGNRYHFKKLVERNWISLQAHPNDSRLKLVVPSEKLIQAFSGITDNLNLVFPELFNSG